jgi:GxxExxY protein
LKPDPVNCCVDGPLTSYWSGGLVLDVLPQQDAMTGAVIGAALEIHRVLGPGFLENIYEQAFALELGLRGIAFERQKIISVMYRGQHVGESRVDFMFNNSLIVELKAVERLLPVHQAQVISYLKASGCNVGLLINFHERLLRDGIKRVVLNRPS